MRFTQNQLWCVSSFGFAALTLLTGCFGGHPVSRGIPLSDAMSASASGSRGNLAGGNSDRVSAHSYEGGMSFSATGVSKISSRQRAEPDESFLVSFAVEEVIPIANDIRTISRLELTPLGFQDDENYVGFYVGAGEVKFHSGSFPDQAITDVWLLDAGLVGRHYFTPPKTFLSPYLTGGVFGQIVLWDYRTPVNVNGEMIQSDSIYGGGGFVGLGLAVARKERLGIFAEVRLGLSLYDQATMQGFYNDVLEHYGFVSIRVGASFKF